MITLTEAIGLLDAIYKDREADNLPQDLPGQQAILLGIEALKYIKEWRLPPHGGATILLPGEKAE